MVEHLRNCDLIVGACYAKAPEKWLEKVRAHYLIKYKYGGVKGVPSTGVNNAFRKEIIDIIGGFDETQTSITADFINRGKKKGLKIHYDPEVYVYTKYEQSSWFFKQKLRWREAGITSLLSLAWWREAGVSRLFSFGYTYGLSIFLFVSLLLSLYQTEVYYIAFAAIITYVLSFSPYFVPFCRMLISREDRYFAAYFLL